MIFEDANQRPECRVVGVPPRDFCKPACETDPQLILPRTAHPLSHPLHARNGPFRYLAEPLLLTGDCHNTVIANIRSCRCHPDICRAPVLVAHCEQYVGVSRSTLRWKGHQFVPLLSTPRCLREWPGGTPTQPWPLPLRVRGARLGQSTRTLGSFGDFETRAGSERMGLSCGNGRPTGTS